MSPFADALAARIARTGPVSVEHFMAEANAHYYATRDPLGVAGDFTTAPEISQMFGELIALFLVQSWRDQGAASPVNLVELGPGRGTLMRDVRRTLLRAAPDFARACQIHLIETSPALRAAQEALLGPELHWHSVLDSVPPGPMLLISNEFFDALPIRQFVRTAVGWAERQVGLSAEGRLVFATSAAADTTLPPGATLCPEGTIFETSPAGQKLTRQIARRLARRGGVALLIDYGHTQSAHGETLQAVKAHRYTGPLAEPGEADLTAHVDFAALAFIAREEGTAVHGPVTQGDFLGALGIGMRAEALKRNASPETAAEIDAARARLTAPDQMGSLFKVMALTRVGAPPLAGFAP